MALSKSDFFPGEINVRNKIDSDITNVTAENAITPAVHGEVLRGSGSNMSGDNIMRLFSLKAVNCRVYDSGYDLQANWTAPHDIIAVLNDRGIANFYGQVKTTGAAGNLIMENFPAPPTRETYITVNLANPNQNLMKPAVIIFKVNGEVFLYANLLNIPVDTIIDFENVVLKVW